MKILKSILIPIFSVIMVAFFVLTTISIAMFGFSGMAMLPEIVMLPILSDTMNFIGGIFAIDYTPFISYIFLGITALAVTAFVAITWRIDTRITNSIIITSKILIAVILVAAAGYAFVVAEIKDTLEIDPIRKWGIGICLGIYLLFRLTSRYLLTRIGRTIQAFESAQEQRTPTRTPILWVNLLKMFEFLFPELILCGMISFMLFNVASSFFIYIACAFVVLFLGSIWTDFNINRESKRVQRGLMSEKVARDAQGK